MKKNNQRQTPVLRVLCVVTAAVMLAACLSGCCGMLSKDGVMRLNTAAVSPDRALTAAPKAYTTLYCTADDFVSLRGKPDAGSEEYAKIPRGDSMRWSGTKKGNWYYVDYGAKSGYVSASYVSTVKPAAITDAADTTASTLYCTADDFVAVRQEATEKSKLLIKVPLGKAMTYQNKKSGKWYLVTYNKVTGYAHGNYLSASKTGTDTTASLLYCIADDFVALRKAPNSSADLLVKIPRGEMMGYLNKKSGKWYLVQYGSQKGYVCGDFISAKKPSPTVLYCTADDFVALRREPTEKSKLLVKIPRGKSMTYQNKKSGKWLYVSYGKQYGYVHENFVSTKKP